MVQKKSGQKRNETRHEDPIIKLDRERSEAIKERDNALSLLNSMKNELNQKQKEIEELQNKVKEVSEQSIAASTSLCKLEDELAKLRQDNERLQRASRGKSKNADVAKNLREEISRLREELDEALGKVRSRDIEVERLKLELQVALESAPQQPKEPQPDDSRGKKCAGRQEAAVQSSPIQELEAQSRAISEKHQQEAPVKEEKAAKTNEPKTLIENLALLAQLAQTIQTQFGQIQDACAKHDAEKTELQKQVEKFEKLYDAEISVSRSREKTITALKKQIEQLEAQITELQNKVDGFQQENIRAAHAIEVLTQERDELRDQASNERKQAASEWAKSLATILSDLSMLVPGNEPDPDRGLSPRAAYENMLNWMERVFNERPRQFPVKKEMTYDDQKHPWIFVDADNEGLENLLAQYDWSPESPFSNLVEGQRRVKLRVQRMGWRVGNNILLKARVTTFAPDGEQPGE